MPSLRAASNLAWPATRTPLAAGGYVAIPRGTPFAIARRGNRPLSLLSVLSGAPCEEAR
jgi:hypothetical protein